MMRLKLLIALLLTSVLLCSIAAREQVSSGNSVPEGCTILDFLWLSDAQEEAFLLLGSEADNAVRLAAAKVLPDGQYLLTALSEPILSLNAYDPDLAYMTLDWRDGNPYFWWGTSNVIQTRAFYLRFKKDAAQGWTISSGYVDDPFTPLKYSFSCDEPGILAVSGDTISPEICWPTELTMTLDDFSPEALERVCLDALSYLEIFKQHHNVDEQDESYRINWW